jgi:virulence factor
LFGEFSISSAWNRIDRAGTTSQMHVKHENGVSGLLELSTHFSWNHPVDSLSVNCEREMLTIQYPLLVKGFQKPGRFFNIPAERLLHQSTTTREYFSTGNMVMPVMELNTLVLQGFYRELEVFINLVENGMGDTPNDLIKLKAVYRILDNLKKLST